MLADAIQELNFFVRGKSWHHHPTRGASDRVPPLLRISRPGGSVKSSQYFAEYWETAYFNKIDIMEVDGYDDRNRAFLQAFMARSTMTFAEAQPVLAAITSAHRAPIFLLSHSRIESLLTP